MLINSREKIKQLREPVNYFTPEELTSRKDEIVEIIRQMEHYLQNEPNAAAIAAPQLEFRVPIISFKRKDGTILSMINPEVINLDKNNIYYSQEGCMSLQFFGKDNNCGLNVFAIRSKDLELTYYHVNHKGEIKRANNFKAKERFDSNGDYVSREASAIQHELNHLHGVLLLDAAVPLDLVKENDDRFAGFTKVYRVYHKDKEENIKADYLIENDTHTIYDNTSIEELQYKDVGTDEEPKKELIKQFVGFFKEKENNEENREISTES